MPRSSPGKTSKRKVVLSRADRNIACSSTAHHDSMQVHAAFATPPRSSSARDVTISETYKPAGNPTASVAAMRQSRRNARFVIPAIGASTIGGSIGQSIGRLSHPRARRPAAHAAD